MLLHQSDRLLIGPLTQKVIDTFKISYTQMGMVDTLALVVGALCYPVWGWLLDRFARPRLLALASLIWGATTWLNAIAPTYPAFLFTRASTGIAASSYPGIYSLLSDYYPPKKRGKTMADQIADLWLIIALIIADSSDPPGDWRRRSSSPAASASSCRSSSSSASRTKAAAPPSRSSPRLRTSGSSNSAGRRSAESSSGRASSCC